MTMHQPFVARPPTARRSETGAGLARKAYDITEGVLWVIAIGMGVLAIAAIHSLPAARDLADRQLAQEIAQESRTFCEARGLPAGTPAHSACVFDLGQIRANQERRMADALAPF